MTANASRDPWLQLPLEGVRLIEASAGTGKTWTVATLVTRLVVERRLRIGEILAVTFTEAATQELRKRIRERLQLALVVLDAEPEEDAASAEATLTRQILLAHLATGIETRYALRRRLRQAVLETDLAAIFTIHGFCLRVLREHALETGHAFDAPELVASDRDLRAEIAADVWRAHASDDDTADDLLALWGRGHEALADDLPALLREPILVPAAAAVPAAADPGDVREAAADALVAEIDAHLEDAQALIAHAYDAKIIHGGRAKRASFDKAFKELVQGRARRLWPRDKGGHIEKLLPENLVEFCFDDKRDQAPASSVFTAFKSWCDADDAYEKYLVGRRAALLHRIRDDARVRMAALKRQRRVQTYDDLIDGVADALAGSAGEVLASRLRGQYRVALVDEFQDTDARQWTIFDRVFGAGSPAPALFLIGDPKQAIYAFRGGDVNTYLKARDSAQEAPALARNFRSRPKLVHALDALYSRAGKSAFSDERIEFHPIEAGGSVGDGDFLRDGNVAPALTLWCAPATGEFNQKGEPVAWSAPASRNLATRACVAAIHEVLSAARAGNAMLRDGDDMRAVQPADIAVLVRSHVEATMIRQALAEVGVPAVAAGKSSLFATPEARELHAVLLALLHIGDDRRLRAALATVLVGVDARGIERLDHDVDASHVRHQDAQGWRERWNRAGTLALIGDLAAQAGARLLGLLDGERRLSNYLQLAELLQEAQRHALGLQGLIDWLEQRIAGADANDETQLLRLESDARRVQIVTLHKSKGLEYPLVFLPFAGIGARTPMQKAGKRVVTNSTDGRTLHWPLDTSSSEWKTAYQAWLGEQSAEDARLLYVGLTRAEHALWVASGFFYNHDKAALAKLLTDVEALASVDGIVLDRSQPPADLPRLPAPDDSIVPAARTRKRLLSGDWWVYSFSQLAKADGGDPGSMATVPASGGNDEPDAAEGEVVEDGFDARYSGNRYGVALHAALEHADFCAWRGWQVGDGATVREAENIAQALRAEGYGADVLDDGIALTTRLIGHTLTVRLPEGVRLCDIEAHQRRAEIEFQFALQPVRVEAVLELLHDHGIVRERHAFGLRQRLEGLMTGLIDLTYHVDGKWYLLDYKSNRLPAYDAASLQRAMAHSEYDLQALIYTLALHRWLRFRLGDGYDYARDFGGVRYLFCRGLDGTRSDSPGIFAHRFIPQLVHALDAMFGHGGAGDAA